MNTAKRLFIIAAAVCVFAACLPQKAVDTGVERSPALSPPSEPEQSNSEIRTATFALG
jgi:hypothetical protein